MSQVRNQHAAMCRSSLWLNTPDPVPEGWCMQLRARLMLGVLFIAFTATLLFALLPVSSSSPSSSAATRTSTTCGSVALPTTAHSDRTGCERALRQRGSIVLAVAIAGFAFGLVDAGSAFVARRRRRRRERALTDAPPRPLGDAELLVRLRASGTTSDLERLILLHESGSISDAHFAAHRAGIRIQG